jgi:hypothetical protein
MIVTILPQTVHLGGIGHPLRVVAHQQQLANTNKRYAFYRNPTQVAVKNLAQYGIAPSKLVKAAVPVRSTTGRPTRRAIVSAHHVLYDVYVAQFGKHGPKGVWSIAFIDVHQP